MQPAPAGGLFPPVRSVENSPFGQLPVLEIREVKVARHIAGIVALDPQGQDCHQDEGTQGERYGDDPFHGGLIAGGRKLVILPGAFRRSSREDRN